MRINDKTNKANDKTLKDIKKSSLEIDSDKVAEEILDWLITNVEYFIDNQVKTFKIDLIVDKENKEMSETAKLQSLFSGIPDDDKLIDAKEIFNRDGSFDMSKFNNKSLDKAAKTRDTLNDITSECLKKMQENAKLVKLYERMAYFYEMTGFYNGKELIRELEGEVNVLKFEYEAFSMNVNVQTPTYQIQKGDGSVKIIESQSKEYVIPEGFTVWIEIAFLDKSKITSLF